MGYSAIPPALLELSNPTTPEAQVKALRDLKNEIVGHDQRKEVAVKHGVVRPLATILKAEGRRGAKRRSNGAINGGGASVGRDGGMGLGAAGQWEWTSEDEMRFQATLVLGSLANGGPALVAPLLNGNVFPPLLEALSPSQTPPKLVMTTLRTIEQIVDAVAQEKPTESSDGPVRTSLSSSVSEQLYTKQVADNFAEILAQTSRSSSVQQQIWSVTKLIIKTCHDEHQKKLLLEAGILDLLAGKLAAMALPEAQALRNEPRNPSREQLPSIYLADVLDAISAIIKDSHYNTARFLYSQPIQQAFGPPKEAATGAYDGFSPQATPWDRLIPRLQTLQSKSDPYTKSWPALGAYTSTATSDSYKRLPGVDSLPPTSRTVITDESENPLFIWLIYAARRAEGKERLASCWLLALLKRFGERWPLNDPSKITRQRHFAYLIMPLVVKMISGVHSGLYQTSKNAYGSLSLQEKQDAKYILERAPLVLAELVSENPTLQNAAVDAKLLPELCQILKKSFDPITATSKPLWSARSSAPQPVDPMIDPASSTLGRPGLRPEILHAFKYRESTLLALAALAENQDPLRKLIVEVGTPNHLMEALVPYSDSQPSGSTTSKGGNPIPVLIAACTVVRKLSRSVSVLRTSLIDNGLATPIQALLTHPDVKVQVAATDALANLLLEVSPVRQEIVNAGGIKTLCEHCRSANFDLRFGSLWALKHVILGLTSSMKIQCLEELGVGWLVQTLNGEPTKTSMPTPLGMGTPNAAGERVDILNAMDDPNMDVDEDTSSEEDEDTMTDSIPSMRRHPRPGSRYTSATNIRDRLQQIKSDEQDVRLSAERDDIRMQEQALDFIRNFINEDKASGEMIDHLLKCFGHSRFFEILDSKIRPKGSTPTSSSSSNNNNNNNPSSQPAGGPGPSYWNPSPSRTAFGTNIINPNISTANAIFNLSQPINWASYPPSELLSAAMYILTHLANGRPQHRSLLISQTTLMSHVLPLIVHPHRLVRLPCSWFIINLTWIDDSSDYGASRERAMSLRQLGFEEGVRVLSRDADQDVRERGKTGIENFARLLEDGGRGVGGGGASAGYGSPSTGGGAFGSEANLGGNGLGRVGSGLAGLHGHRAWGGGGGV
ncbi:armadillo-type protein [Clohesyomyces aquaticus]|uniref:Armadillo-type protein n=1 Tax=Clohesyomyces aquaticus TaxID=1231657 RepID=A0A1Y2A660_9PLEO|nr:armadillo-type protein [Clohesyomyces aquaticus]